MPRQGRAAPGGLIYHVLNRANARATIFHKPEDYAAFERVLAEALAKFPGLRLLTYCLMPNHWHLVVWPAADGHLSRFMGWLTMTHTQRWHAHRHTAGSGHLYQGRFKSFPVEADGHFLTVCRYVERNALRAGLAANAQDWRWGGLWRRLGDRRVGSDAGVPPLSAWPVDEPVDWLDVVNRPQTAAEEEALQRSIARSRPFGSDPWLAVTVASLGLESTLRARGGQRKRQPTPTTV